MSFFTGAEPSSFHNSTFNSVAGNQVNNHIYEERDSVISYDDPSARIWSVYVSQADKQDDTLAENWKGDMDAILIFAGLFSAVTTSFIIQSYQTLQPASGDTTVVLLAQISQQLAGISNGSYTPSSDHQNQFKPTTSNLVVNALWFLSLGFSLTCAFAATLVQQWTRGYLQAAKRHPSPVARARVRAFLYHGLERFGLAAVAGAIPTLLHISLLLFFIGLTEFLRPVNLIISFLALGMLAVGVSLYAVITWLPLVHLDCPYQTPLTLVSWHMVQLLPVFKNLFVPGKDLPLKGTMVQAREKKAIVTDSSVDSQFMDESSLRWTMETLTEKTDLELFVEGIPGYLTSNPTFGREIMRKLQNDDEHGSGIRLGTRINDLLRTCQSDGTLVENMRRKRAMLCMTAIWTLVSGSLLEDRKPTMWRDSMQIVSTLKSIDNTDYAQSVAAVVITSLLHPAGVTAVIENLVVWEGRLGQNQPLDLRQSSAMLRAGRRELDKCPSSQLFELVKSMRIFSAEDLVSECEGPVQRLGEEMELLRETPEGQESRLEALQRTTKMLLLLRQLKQIQADIRFIMLLGYVNTPRDRPESLNTIRAMAVDLDVRPKSPQNQSRFLTSLTSAIPLGSPTRFRSDIIDVLLQFVGVLDSQDDRQTALDIIYHYAERNPGSEPAKSAISTLRNLLGL